jgi:putative membrane protein
MNTPSRLVPLSLLVSGLLLGGLAHARSDSAFMKQAAQNGHAEIQASQAATTKATRPEVKSFAEKMIADHTKVADELKTLAASKKVELPTEPSLKQKGELKLVTGADGDKFDARYSQAFGVKAHEETIKLFEEAAKDAKDPEVKAWAEKTLPGLKHHLEMAKALPTAPKK